MPRLLLLAIALFGPPQAMKDHSAIFDVASEAEIRMDLSAGEYKIVGGSNGKVRVSWSADDQRDADDVRVRFRSESDSVRLETDDTKDVRVEVQVPVRSNLYIRLSAGELSVSGIEGNKDIGLKAGELRIDVGDPAKYRDIHSSVRIGEISAHPFNVRKGGFFRGFDLNGKGTYSLRATVGVGEVTLTR